MVPLAVEHTVIDPLVEVAELARPSKPRDTPSGVVVSTSAYAMEEYSLKAYWEKH